MSTYASYDNNKIIMRLYYTFTCTISNCKVYHMEVHVQCTTLFGTCMYMYMRQFTCHSLNVYWMLFAIATCCQRLEMQSILSIMVSAIGWVIIENSSLLLNILSRLLRFIINKNNNSELD